MLGNGVEISLIKPPNPGPLSFGGPTCSWQKRLVFIPENYALVQKLGLPWGSHILHRLIYGKHEEIPQILTAASPTVL